MLTAHRPSLPICRAFAYDFVRADAVAMINAATSDIDAGLLVAATGFGTSGPLFDAPLEPELEMVDVNCRAVLALSHEFGQGMHLELGPRGVDVLSSAPGPISSGFASRARMTMGMTQTPADVARASLDALGRQGTVRPGWLAKGLASSLMFLPRWGRVRMMGLVMAGMTKHGSDTRSRAMPRGA